MSVSSIETARSFLKPGRQPRPRQSPPPWQKGRPLSAFYSRRAALFHGLTALGMPVVCVESRQAYQALRSMVTHKTDRNDARGLAHLARAGFFKPVHVKSLPSHAVRALLIARKKLVGQRVTLENQIRGLAVAFGVRLPRGLSSL